MHILVTNDDGINAPGLLALVQAMRELGKVTVVAPDHNWSASGHVKTFHRPIRVRETVLADDSKAYQSDGAPSDCVAVALLGFIKQKIDLVVSGINPSANIGDDVTYSGTVTAAMEGAISGIPSMAVSQDYPENFKGKRDYSTCARVAREVAGVLMEKKLPSGIFINLNVPYLPYESLKGYCITRQGIRLYHDVLVRRKDPRGKPYYWIGGPLPTGVPKKDTDYGAIKSGYVSITPLELDLTAATAIKTMKSWKFNLKK